MRILISLLIGFVLGFLLLGSAMEWLIDSAAGSCSVYCPEWRDAVTVTVSTLGWMLLTVVTHLTWQRIWPQMAPSARQENIRRLRRGGW